MTRRGRRLTDGARFEHNAGGQSLTHQESSLDASRRCNNFERLVSAIPGEIAARALASRLIRVPSACACRAGVRTATMPSSLLAMLDDIATGLDGGRSVWRCLAKVAAQEAASVLGDDLALNAQQVSGVSANRELPVGHVGRWPRDPPSSTRPLLVPAALVVSAVAPWGVTPLLMIGGAFLCYAGVEGVPRHKLFRGEAEDEAHESTPS